MVFLSSVESGAQKYQYGIEGKGLGTAGIIKKKEKSNPGTEKNYTFSTNTKHASNAQLCTEISIFAVGYQSVHLDEDLNYLNLIFFLFNTSG